MIKLEINNDYSKGEFMKKTREKLRYQFDQFLSKGTVSLVLSLFVILFVIVISMGLLLYFVFPESQLSTLIWTSFMQTLDPGNLSGENGTLFYMVIMTLATIVGIFITSLFISFILNGFQNKLENLSKGRSKVIESNHTLILGWDANVYVVIKELIEANKSVKKPVIVILSDHDSLEMNQNIKDNINHTYNTKIICRSGSIYKKDDLDMCNIKDAKSLIILENDMNTIKSLLVITHTSFYQKEEGHISVLMYDESNIEVAKNIGKDKLEVIYLKSAITRIMTQTCLQAGLSYVYNELLEFEGDEIYFYDASQLIGLNFKEALLRFDNAILIGIVRDKKTMVRPSMETLIEDHDQLILIVEDEDKAVVNEDIPALNESKIKAIEHYSSLRKEYISIIGYNHKIKDIIHELDHYLEVGSKIRILVNSEEYIHMIDQFDIDANKIEIDIVVGETYSREVLDKFIQPSCKYVMIFANENVDDHEQDSQTLLTLLHLRDIEEKRGENLDIITEITDVRNTEIVDLAKVDDFIVSELIANKMLAQISENRHLTAIFDDLMSSEGSEIYLKPIEQYIEIDEPIDFYTVSASASHKVEIAIGYKLKNKNHLPVVKLNPNKTETIQFHPGDMLIVISED